MRGGGVRGLGRSRGLGGGCFRAVGAGRESENGPDLEAARSPCSEFTVRETEGSELSFMTVGWCGALREVVEAFGVAKGLSDRGVGEAVKVLSISSNCMASSAFLRTWCAPLL